MLDQEGANNFFNQVMALWVNPEIERRKQEGTIQAPIIINKCLITLPSNDHAIVQFNDEFGWIATIKKAPGTAFEKGQAVHLHEIITIEKVKLPEIDGKPVAFVFFTREGPDTFQIVFDFSPNHPGFKADNRDSSPLAQQIASLLRTKLVEQAIAVQISCQEQLRKIGLWTVPCLLPYPLAKIVLELETNNTQQARKILLDYCTPDFFVELSAKWWAVNEFNFRKGVLESALTAHREGKYVLSIPALLPHIEGIVTDWIYTQESVK